MKTSYPNQVRTGILDGITDAQEARNALHVLQASAAVTDDSNAYQKMGGYYLKNDDNEYIWLGSEMDASAPNRFLVQGDSSGVWVHKKENGTWSTILQSISKGGTGASTVNGALQNFNLAPKSGQNFSAGMFAYGYVSNGGTEAIMNFPVSFFTTSTITLGKAAFTTFTCSLRIVSGGYLGGAINSNLLSNITTAELRSYGRGFYVVLTKSAGWGVTNNTPFAGNINIAVKFP